MIQKLLIVSAASITFAFAQSSTAAKPPAAGSGTVTGPGVTNPPLPSLNSAKFWMLVAKIQSLRQQLEQTDAGKALKTAEDDMQKEQARLVGLCGQGSSLGYQQDAKADNAGDVVCLAKPPDPAPGKVEPPKGK